MIGMCERETTERERQEREDRNKECRLEDCFQLQFDWPEWIERTQTTSNQQRTNQQHYTNIARTHTHIADLALKQNCLSLNPLHCSSQMEHKAATQALQKELQGLAEKLTPVSYTHLRAHET